MVIQKFIQDYQSHTKYPLDKIIDCQLKLSLQNICSEFIEFIKVPGKSSTRVSFLINLENFHRNSRSSASVNFRLLHRNLLNRQYGHLATLSSSVTISILKFYQNVEAILWQDLEKNVFEVRFLIQELPTFLKNYFLFATFTYISRTASNIYTKNIRTIYWVFCWLKDNNKGLRTT